MNIIEEKFNDWTKDLSPEESLINIFEKIRDIPYTIVPEQFDLEKGPYSILTDNKGFCVPKHYLLGIMLEKLGITVRYHTFSFKWTYLDLQYPEYLKELAMDLPITYHLACKADIGGEWVLIDTTWDIALKKASFPVNVNWDGRSDTLNAVIPIEEYIHTNASERDLEFDKKIKSYSLPEKLTLSRFSIEINKWLDEIRKTI